MIRNLEVEDIAKIAFLKDHLEQHFPCSKGEWVQFLITQVNNPKMKIFGDVDEEGTIKGYMILFDNVVPPIFDSCVALFVWTQEGNYRCNKDILRPLIIEAKKWAREIGAKKGIVNIPINHSEEFMVSIGGKKIASAYEWSVEE